MAVTESLPAAMENGESKGGGDYTQDGSVDLRGNPVLRSKRGGWTACSFIVVYELFERMAYYGIAANLVIYLTDKLHQGTVEASNNVTNWSGAVFIMPLIGAYVADAYLGRYWTFVAGSAIYFLGMCLLTLAVTIPSLKPPPCDGGVCPPASALQLGVYFGGLYIIAFGNGGTKPNISTIGADQFDEFDPREKMHKMSFFNWWMFTIFVGILFSSTVLVYLQDNISWSVGYGIPTLGLLISISIFLAGTPLYRHKVPQGSPFTRMGKVVAAAVWKWRVAVPADAKELHELELEEYTRKRKFRIDSTNTMRFLNKAAVKDGSPAKWSLCTVTQVEETKQIIKVVPLLATMFVPCTLIAQTNTLFVKQGRTMNRHIGPHFQIPPASLGAFVTLSMLVAVVVYDRLFVRAIRKYTKNPRGIPLLKRMGVGLLLQVLAMATASLMESRRLSYARRHGLVRTGGVVPLTILELLPQYVLMGVADAFLVVGKIEFFYDQAPESMKSLGTAMSLTAYGVGNVLSSFLLSLVSRVTQERGDPWVTNNLNASHLDYYYGFLTVLGAVNAVVFVVLSSKYSYKVESTETIDIAMDVKGETAKVQS
ncbi:protein NRT1/ PTR FAMILY 5.2-like [Oryza brachyantha]|uniref:Major facilitator superfamily (MFS) profile domain-containing protein n=1 Tax=Oryza brachyantha TaxID=4533 RepID=J3LJT2_ORYBR|nr:protein NRT1/ PTR FAMILY 5.2-like [Oryza brachyantha]